MCVLVPLAPSPQRALDEGSNGLSAAPRYEHRSEFLQLWLKLSSTQCLAKDTKPSLATPHSPGASWQQPLGLLRLPTPDADVAAAPSQDETRACTYRIWKPGS